MSTYINDSASAGELARLDHQAGLVGKATGLLPATLEGTPFTTVLDVGCGPGRWALDFAFWHPDAEVAGIDISPIMIDYANARAHTQLLPNASFGVQDFLQHYSYYHEEENRAWLTSFQRLLIESAPFLLKSGVTTIEELAELDQKMAIDMYHHTFCGIGPLFTFFAHKPGNEEEASSAR